MSPAARHDEYGRQSNNAGNTRRFKRTLTSAFNIAGAYPGTEGRVNDIADKYDELRARYGDPHSTNVPGVWSGVHWSDARQIVDGTMDLKTLEGRLREERQGTIKNPTATRGAAP